jgi:hypothetical protein
MWQAAVKAASTLPSSKKCNLSLLRHSAKTHLIRADEG